ncbi:unknown [Feldmannia species virus]|uniref:Holliday junction resolvase n=1 Tax=Feldmannia species virus TaxID=39420 RepID=B5LWC2_9PHYC|nr:hypothetical protein FeldSpV_gp033 [Feldmannia species virus]ACH46785.1 unknown [Feldmannia species virus]
MAVRVLSIDVGIVNLAYCIIDFEELAPGAFRFDLVHVEKGQVGTVRQSTHQLAKNVIHFFKKAEPIQRRKVDVILIEQQMTRAIKNSILAYTIMSYFYTNEETGAAQTCFVQPWKKFQATRIAFENSGCLRGINFNVCGSRELKRLSVEVAKQIFAEFQVLEGLRVIEEYKPKLDDVCDVFLQSFAFFLLGKKTGRLTLTCSAKDSE